jgi:hypothetical protein
VGKLALYTALAGVRPSAVSTLHEYTILNWKSDIMFPVTCPSACLSPLMWEQIMKIY